METHLQGGRLPSLHPSVPGVKIARSQLQWYLMISAHFPRMFVEACNDDGVYYARQVDETDGIEDFDGLVWFGQQMRQDPSFANVFVGRLRPGGRDPSGTPADVWEGRYIDVPKGRTCGSGPLSLKTFVVPPVATRAGCDFPEPYLMRQGSSRFGGSIWGVPLSGCWRQAFEDGAVSIAPPRVPPLVAAAYGRGPGGFLSAVVALGSDLTAPGFERPGDDLTGTWHGDDDGTYYVTQEGADIVWYAESPSARPMVSPDQPPQGWANVFSGTRARQHVDGMWVDVPRGAADRAGRLSLELETPRFAKITRQTGGYGGRRLWKVSALDVTVRVPELTVERPQESSGDEPLLYLVFFKVDGTTVDLDDLRGSSVTVTPRPDTRLGEAVRGTVSIPVEIGSFDTTLITARSSADTAVEEATRLGVIAYAIEVDPGYSAEFRRMRAGVWWSHQANTLNAILRRGRIPTASDLRTAVNTIYVRYLGPWEGPPWGDPDDVLSGDVSIVTFRELAGSSVFEDRLTFSGEGARYSARVVVEARSRLNERCA